VFPEAKLLNEAVVGGEAERSPSGLPSCEADRAEIQQSRSANR